MKILAIHNFHRKGSASGDDQVFKSETLLVILFQMTNLIMLGCLGKLLVHLECYGVLKIIRLYKKL